MTKVAALTLALLLTFAMTAAAEQMAGTVKSVNAEDRSFVLDDGTQLWVDANQIAELTPGDKVLATYEMQGDKKIVTEIDRRTKGPDGQETTNFGSKGN
jgi:uncharacterized protein DUF1344